MNLNDYKLVFVTVCLIGILLFASPVLSQVITQPMGEQFSELYLLDSNHLTENYPFNVELNQNYSVYVGVTNHMSSSIYYLVAVKLCNQTDQLPNATDGIPCPVPSSYDFRFFLKDSLTWETPLNFSISEASFSGNTSYINTIRINDLSLNVDKSTLWDSNSSTLMYQLLFELWIYNPQSNMFTFNDRFVYFPLNLTRTI